MEKKIIVDEIRFKSTANAIIVEYEKEYGTRDISFKDFFGENYKYTAYEKGRKALAADTWTTDMIGTGEIFNSVMKALSKANNLVYFTTDTFESKAKANMKKAEKLIYNIYNENDDEQAFYEFTKFFGRISDKTAYIFFLKDKERYLPLSPNKFGKRLEMFGITTQCTRGMTWEHYMEFIDIMKYVQIYLNRELVKNASLLDAHSFIWAAYKLEDQKTRLLQDEIEKLVLQRESLEAEIDTLAEVPEIPDLTGMCIQHNKWGKGTIKAHNRKCDKVEVYIKFDSECDTKKIQLIYIIGKFGTISREVDDIIISHFYTKAENEKVKAEKENRINIINDEIKKRNIELEKML